MARAATVSRLARRQRPSTPQLPRADVSRASTIRDFLSYIAGEAGTSLVRAVGLLLVASVTESLSLLLIVPLVGFLTPGRAELQFHVPARWASISPLHGVITIHLALGLAVFVGLVAIRSVAVWAKEVEVVRIMYSVSNRMRIRLFRSLSQARWGYLVNLRSSDLNHALNADVDRVQTAVAQLLLLIQAATLIAVYAGLSLLISPWMTLFAVGTGLIMLVVLQPLRRRARAYGEAFSRARQDQYATVDQFLSALKVVKAGNAESSYVARLGRGLDTLLASTLKYTRVNSFANATFQFTTAIIVAVFVVVALQVAHLSRGAMIIQLLLFLRLGPRIMGLQQQVQDVLVNLGSFNAMRSLEAESTTHAETVTASGSPLNLDFEIKLEKVSFQYSLGERPALHEVDAIIPAGRTTALIAASGGGKSTLADLILGLESPISGRILIDGVELTGDRRRGWRDQVAYVSQEVVLLNDTVAVNLRLTRPNATEDDLWGALAAAQLDGVVRRAPGGLKTQVGDRGVRLSGGERQRLALARALLRRPKLLILDEATSALDWENQAAIARVITGLRGRCTVVTIAHRPSMIEFADWVVALDAGRVTETGAFADLASDPSSRLAKMLAAESA